MGLAVALFHPGRDQPDGNAAGMRLGCIERIEQGKPFEIAPGGIDDLDPPGICRIQNRPCACPETADIFGFVNHGVGCVVRGARDVEARIEHAGLSVRRAPARERDKGVKVKFQARLREQRAEWFARMKPGLGG